MSNDASREEFEVWATGILGDNPNWRESATKRAWTAWQASRKALEAEPAQAVEQEPFAYYNVGIWYHTKDKTVFHKKPTENLETRWWGPDTPLYTQPAPPAQAVEPVAVVFNRHYEQHIVLADGVMHKLYLRPPPQGDKQ